MPGEGLQHGVRQGELAVQVQGGDQAEWKVGNKKWRQEDDGTLPQIVWYCIFCILQKLLQNLTDSCNVCVVIHAKEIITLYKWSCFTLVTQVNIYWQFCSKFENVGALSL